MIYNMTKVYGGGLEAAFVHKWVPSVSKHIDKCKKILKSKGVNSVKVKHFKYEQLHKESN
jgi:hypothetical protein